MNTRKEKLKALSSKLSQLDEFSYSAIMRYLYKTKPEQIKEFMKIFYKSFEKAVIIGLENPEEPALMETVKIMDLQNELEEAYGKI